MNTRSLLPFAAAALATSVSAHAVVLAEYTFAESAAVVNNPSSAQTAPSVTATFVDATSTSKGSGISGTTNYNLFPGNGGFPNTAIAIRDTNVANEAAAITGNKFFEFTVSAQSGYQLSLTDITFDWARGGTSGDRSFSVRVSTDGFTNSTQLGTQSTLAGASSTWTVDQTYSIGLTSVTQPVTFRFYVWTPGSATADMRFDNITINGTVSAIPEPSAFAALAGLGTLGLAATRRRRRA